MKYNSYNGERQKKGTGMGENMVFFVQIQKIAQNLIICLFPNQALLGNGNNQLTCPRIN
ncbi:hypothetical protein RvVAR031_02440 [Agrobacterium vitis]|nr:hypothetical protein RvVAR031_02440 [Agrobacterium vitis]